MDSHKSPLLTNTDGAGQSYQTLQNNVHDTIHDALAAALLEVDKHSHWTVIIVIENNFNTPTNEGSLYYSAAF